MSDNKEALPVLGYRYEFKLDESCRFDFYAGQMPYTTNWIEVALTDHATATAAISELRAEVDRLRARAELYETVRKLNSRDFSELWMTNIREGTPFDDLVAAFASASGESAEGGV